MLLIFRSEDLQGANKCNNNKVSSRAYLKSDLKGQLALPYVLTTVTTRSQRDCDFFLVENLRDSRPSSVPTTVIIFVVHLTSRGGIWARRCEWERRPGRLSTPHRTDTLVRPLPVASTPYSSDTESADAESTPANRNQYHAGLLRRGLLFS